MLVHTESPAYTRSGFNPIIFWEASEFDVLLTRLKDYGALVEGEPQTTPQGKIIYLQSPDGLSMALKEEIVSETKAEPTPDDHPAAPELKKLFEKLKL